MNKLQIVKQEIAGESNPLKPVKSTPVNFDAQTIDCAKLQDVVPKNTELSSICPWYSNKQLRRIDRIRIRKYRYGHGNIKSLSPYVSSTNMEAIL